MSRTDLIAEILMPLPKPAAKPFQSERTAAPDRESFEKHLPEGMAANESPEASAQQNDTELQDRTPETTDAKSASAQKIDKPRADASAPETAAPDTAESDVTLDTAQQNLALVLNLASLQEVAPLETASPDEAAPAVAPSDAATDSLLAAIDSAQAASSLSQNAQVAASPAPEASTQAPALAAAIVAPALNTLPSPAATLASALTTDISAVESVPAETSTQKSVPAKADATVASAIAPQGKAQEKTPAVEGDVVPEFKASTEETQAQPVASDQSPETIKSNVTPAKPETAAVKTEAAPAKQDAAIQQLLQSLKADVAPTVQAQHAPVSGQHTPAALQAGQPPVMEAQQAQLRAPMALERVPFEITAAAHKGEKEFTIRLDPPELGRVDVSVSVDKGGKVSTHLVVERSETLDQLRRDSQNLERAFQNSGLKTDSGSLQFSLRDQNAQNFSHDPSDHGPTKRGVMEVELVQQNGWIPPQYAYLGPARGSGIDMRV